jgi:hypothetical protein
MRAAAALLALPALLALTAQTPPPHPRPSASPNAHHNGREGSTGRPAIIIVTGVSTAATAKPSPAGKPTPTPMGDPQVFETHSSTDAR